MVSDKFIEEVLFFPEMLEAVPFIPKKLTLPGLPKAIFIAGMGGSAVAGDILSDYLRDTLKIPIFVVRNYSIPAFAKKNDLLIAVSYSGNTEETLNVFKTSINKDLQIVCVAGGGILRKLAIQHKYPFVQIPIGLQPRSALPYILVALLKIFEKVRLISSQNTNISEAVQLIYRLREEWGQGKNNPVIKTAKVLLNKSPIIFSTSGLTDAAGYRLKCQFNENSKVTAHLASFPELNHNEIVNLSYLRSNQHDYILLILRDKEENTRVQRRIAITKALLSSNVGKIIEIRSFGKGRLARLLSLVFWGDLLTVYSAEIQKIDPSDVSVIEKLKKALRHFNFYNREPAQSGKIKG